VPSTPTGGGSTPRPTCLIVDDDEGIRSLLVAIVEHAGVRCLLAPDVARAQELLASEPVDVVLLDFSLLAGDPLAFVAGLRALEPAPDVIVVTGRREADLRERVLEAGASAFVTKPFHAAALRDAVLGVLERRRGAPAG
jgi:DNA-binding response OmpR family regulator